MEINEKIQNAINDQINFELYSGYIYLSMSTWFEEKNLAGMAHWMRVQAKEEYEHAMRFYNFVTDRGGRVIMKPIAGPKTEWASPMEAFDEAYGHEKEVSKRIYAIGKLAEEEGDKATESFLKWFYDEQVEEEEQTMRIRDLLEMIGTNIAPLFQLDAKLGARED